MGATDVIKNAFTYPLIDKKKWMMVGVIFLIINVFGMIGAQYTGWAWLTGIITFILDLFIIGYGVSVVGATLKGGDEVPDFAFGKNFVDGIKAIVLYFIYYVIPLIITLIVAAVTGLFTNIGKATTAIANAPALNASAAATGNTAGSLSAMFSSYSAVVPTTIQSNIMSAATITAIVGIILFIIFALFANVGLARMAETDSLKEGLRFGAVNKKLSSIGWGKYVAWYILLIIVLIVLGFVASAIALIPYYIGAILSGLLVSSFIFLFTFAAIGKIYNEG